MLVINYAAILVAALAAMVVGSVWYSPLLFGPQWMKLRGIKSSQGMQMPAKEMFVEFVGVLVTVYVLDIFIIAFGAHSYQAAILLALVIWLGFYVTAQLSEALWEKRPFGIFLINTGQRLVTLIVIMLILGLWP